MFSTATGGIRKKQVMKVRRPRTASNRLWKFPLQILPFFVIAAPVTLIFFFSSRSISTTTLKKEELVTAELGILMEPPRNSSEIMGNCPTPQLLLPPEKDDTPPLSVPKIVYTKVDAQSSASVHRFAAMEHCHDGSIVPVSVLRWAYWMASGEEAVTRNVTQIVNDSPFAAVRFETKGVTVHNAPQKPFEFVLVDAPGLATFASDSDPHTFAEHLKCPPVDAAGCVFDNLGRDALLVAPKVWKSETKNNINVYGHLAAFCRGAPEKQVSQVWSLAAKTFYERLSPSSSTTVDADKTVWFSTAGDGVAWLHFRFDSRPKYYEYKPFAKEI